MPKNFGLMVPLTLATLAAACGAPPFDSEEGLEEHAAAVTAEQFFDTRPQTEQETGLTSWGIKARLMEAFDVDREVVYTFSLTTPSSSSPRTKKGKVTYSVFGEKLTVNFTAKIASNNAVTITGTANGVSFHESCDSRERPTGGGPWQVSSNIEFVSGWLGEDLSSKEFTELESLGAKDRLKCIVAGCMSFQNANAFTEGVFVPTELGVLTYCR